VNTNGRYAQLSEHWHAHPKILGVGLDGMGLHAWAMSYSMHRLTDGFVPAGALPNLPRLQAALKVLLQVGLFERTEGGYRIHDYLQWQPSRAELEAARARAAQRQARLRRERSAISFPENGQFPAQQITRESQRTFAGRPA